MQKLDALLLTKYVVVYDAVERPHTDGRFSRFLRVMHTNLCCRVILHIREAASEKDNGTIIGRAQVFTTSLQFAVHQRRERGSVILTNIGPAEMKVFMVESQSHVSGIVAREEGNTTV